MRISDWSSDVCSSDLALVVRAVPGVDVLPEQRDFAHAARNERRRLGDQVGERPADLGAARIGHDAVSAEFVAAFLHGQERRRALAARACRSAEHTTELQSLMRISYAVFCWKK